MGRCRLVGKGKVYNMGGSRWQMAERRERRDELTGGGVGGGGGVRIKMRDRNRRARPKSSSPTTK